MFNVVYSAVLKCCLPLFVIQVVSRQLRPKALLKRPTIMYLNLIEHHKGQICKWDG